MLEPESLWDAIQLYAEEPQLMLTIILLCMLTSLTFNLQSQRPLVSWQFYLESP